LRINETGMLCIAHKIVTDGGGQLFVSFTFQPDEALYDEGDAGVKEDCNDTSSVRDLPHRDGSQAESHNSKLPAEIAVGGDGMSTTTSQAY
jgi:hypothetical protein